MATAAFTGMGSVFTWNSNPIAEVLTISGPKNSAAEIDVTNMDSTGDYAEFIAGMLDAGEIALSMNFVPADAGQASFNTDFNARTTAAWSLVLPDTGACSISGNGYIKSYSIDDSAKDAVKLNVTIRCSGPTTVTP